MFDDINKKIKDWDKFYILTDFDRTLTKGNSESSWGVLSKSNLIDKDYIETRGKLYEYYRPYEVDLTMDYNTKNRLMVEWWSNHIKLLVKYKFREEYIEKVIRDTKVLSFRKGVVEFFNNMHNNNVPIVIVSAGIGNFIDEFLKQNGIMYDNVYIISNFIKFVDGIAVGIEGNIIHSLNKNEECIPDSVKNIIKDIENVVVIGDGVDDVKMVDDEKRSDALKIGFLTDDTKDKRDEFLKVFDIVLDTNGNFDDIMKEIDIFKFN